MKKYNTFITVIIICIICVFGSLKPVEAKPRLNKKNIKLDLSDTFRLKIKGAKGKVKWKSSKPRYVSVNKKGKIKALKSGKVTITAIYKGKKYRCTVIVKKIVNKQMICTPSPAPVTTTPMPEPTVSMMPEPTASITPKPTATPNRSSNMQPTPTPVNNEDIMVYPTVNGDNYFEKWYVKEIDNNNITISDNINPEDGFEFELELSSEINVVLNGELLLGRYDKEFDFYDAIGLDGERINLSEIKVGDVVDVVYNFYPYPDGNDPLKRNYCTGINVHRE